MKKVIETMEGSAQLQDGHYRFQLPFRGKDVAMPNNLTSFIMEVINNGYTARVLHHQLEATKGKV